MIELGDKGMLEPIHEHFRQYHNEHWTENALKDRHRGHHRYERCREKREGGTVELDEIPHSDNAEHQAELEAFHDV